MYDVTKPLNISSETQAYLQQYKNRRKKQFYFCCLAIGDRTLDFILWFHLQGLRSVVHRKAHKTVSGLHSDRALLSLINLLDDKWIFSQHRIMVASYDCCNYHHDSFRRVSLHADWTESHSVITRAKGGFVALVSIKNTDTVFHWSFESPCETGLMIFDLVIPKEGLAGKRRLGLARLMSAKLSSGMTMRKILRSFLCDCSFTIFIEHVSLLPQY